jgi:hypothetical protein
VGAKTFLKTIEYILFCFAGRIGNLDPRLATMHRTVIPVMENVKEPLRNRGMCARPGGGGCRDKMAIVSCCACALAGSGSSWRRQWAACGRSWRQTRRCTGPHASGCSGCVRGPHKLCPLPDLLFWKGDGLRASPKGVNSPARPSPQHRRTMLPQLLGTDALANSGNDGAGAVSSRTSATAAHTSCTMFHYHCSQ